MARNNIIRIQNGKVFYLSEDAEETVWRERYVGESWIVGFETVQLIHARKGGLQIAYRVSDGFRCYDIAEEDGYYLVESTGVSLEVAPEESDPFKAFLCRVGAPSGVVVYCKEGQVLEARIHVRDTKRVYPSGTKFRRVMTDGKMEGGPISYRDVPSLKRFSGPRRESVVHVTDATYAFELQVRVDKNFLTGTFLNALYLWPGAEVAVVEEAFHTVGFSYVPPFWAHDPYPIVEGVGEYADA